MTQQQIALMSVAVASLDLSSALNLAQEPCFDACGKWLF
jgi:hypothetical protein